MMDQSDNRPIALIATAVVGRDTTNYPPPFAQRVFGRIKRPLGEQFGIAAFGVNFTTLPPGGQSALKHRHRVQEEFVFVVEGELVLIQESNEARLTAGMCAGFVPSGEAHHLVNRSDKPATYLEIGDRRPGDAAEYPDDDLVASQVDGA